jgi:hypothetical protein
MPLSARELRLTPGWRREAVIHSKSSSRKPRTFSKGLESRGSTGHGLELEEGSTSFLFIVTVLEEVPDPTEKRAQAANLWVCLDDLSPLLPLLVGHALFGLEQDIAVLPEALGQGLELVPRRTRLLTADLVQTAPLHRPLPQRAPGVLQDVEGVILEGNRWAEDRADGVVVGLAAVDASSHETRR